MHYRSNSHPYEHMTPHANSHFLGRGWKASSPSLRPHEGETHLPPPVLSPSRPSRHNNTEDSLNFFCLENQISSPIGMQLEALDESPSLKTGPMKALL